MLLIVVLFVLLASIIASLGILSGPVLFPLFNVFMFLFSSSSVISFGVSFVLVFVISFIFSFIVFVHVSWVLSASLAWYRSSK